MISTACLILIRNHNQGPLDKTVPEVCHCIFLISTKVATCENYFNKTVFFPATESCYASCISKHEQIKNIMLLCNNSSSVPVFVVRIAAAAVVAPCSAENIARHDLFKDTPQINEPTVSYVYA